MNYLYGHYRVGFPYPNLLLPFFMNYHELKNVHFISMKMQPLCKSILIVSTLRRNNLTFSGFIRLAVLIKFGPDSIPNKAPLRLHRRH